jgi:hypothetical protein
MSSSSQIYGFTVCGLLHGRALRRSVDFPPPVPIKGGCALALTVLLDCTAPEAQMQMSYVFANLLTRPFASSLYSYPPPQSTKLRHLRDTAVVRVVIDQLPLLTNFPCHGGTPAIRTYYYPSLDKRQNGGSEVAGVKRVRRVLVSVWLNFS